MYTTFSEEGESYSVFVICNVRKQVTEIDSRTLIIHGLQINIFFDITEISCTEKLEAYLTIFYHTNNTTYSCQF